MALLRAWCVNCDYTMVTILPTIGAPLRQWPGRMAINQIPATILPMLSLGGFLSNASGRYRTGTPRQQYLTQDIGHSAVARI